jgi:hypothetical protein
MAEWTIDLILTRPSRALEELQHADRRIQELLETVDRYLTRARTAEDRAEAQSTLADRGKVFEDEIASIRRVLSHKGYRSEGRLPSILVREAIEQAKGAQHTEPLAFTYRNWRGEVGERKVIPRYVHHGATEWHPEPQYLLRAFDLDKQADRDFAVKDIGAQEGAQVDTTPKRCPCGSSPGECGLENCQEGAQAGEVVWCQPRYEGKDHPRKFMIVFEDAEVGNLVFDDETDARKRFEQLEQNWNCYLFGLMPRGPLYTTPPAPDDAVRAAVEAERKACAKISPPTSETFAYQQVGYASGWHDAIAAYRKAVEHEDRS